MKIKDTKKLEDAIESVRQLLIGFDYSDHEKSDYKCYFCEKRPESDYDLHVEHEKDCTGIFIHKLLNKMLKETK